MKTYIILTLGILFFLTACNQDPINEPIDITDFTGDYIGVLECTGDLWGETGSTLLITIAKKPGSEKDYTIVFEDDVQFDATVEDKILSIPNQVFNEEFDFDQVRMKGTLVELDPGKLNFNFVSVVDDEPSSQCTSILIKQ